MLDRYIVIEEWLAADPHLSAVDILSRLEEQALGRFRQPAAAHGPTAGQELAIKVSPSVD
jgi:hypothetical protein